MLLIDNPSMLVGNCQLTQQPDKCLHLRVNSDCALFKTLYRKNPVVSGLMSNVQNIDSHTDMHISLSPLFGVIVVINKR